FGMLLGLWSCGRRHAPSIRSTVRHEELQQHAMNAKTRLGWIRLYEQLVIRAWFAVVVASLDRPCGSGGDATRPRVSAVSRSAAADRTERPAGKSSRHRRR